jgi:hypothetical protein
MRSVPPRGSGWVFGFSIDSGNRQTHPLPRGGTDLISLLNSENHLSRLAAARAPDSLTKAGDGIMTLQSFPHLYKPESTRALARRHANSPRTNFLEN